MYFIITIQNISTILSGSPSHSLYNSLERHSIQNKQMPTKKEWNFVKLPILSLSRPSCIYCTENLRREWIESGRRTLPGICIRFACEAKLKNKVAIVYLIHLTISAENILKTNSNKDFVNKDNCRFPTI